MPDPSRYPRGEAVLLPEELAGELRRILAEVEALQIHAGSFFVGDRARAIKAFIVDPLRRLRPALRAIDRCLDEGVGAVIAVLGPLAASHACELEELTRALGDAACTLRALLAFAPETTAPAAPQETAHGH